MSATMNARQPQQHKTPAWVNMAIVALVLLAGAWAVWQFGVKAPGAVARPRTETLATPSKNMRGGGRPDARQVMDHQPRREPRSPDELRLSGSGDVRGRRGDLVFNISKNKTGFGRIYLDSFSRERWVSRDEYRLHILSYNLANTSKMAQAVGLTAEQREKLNAHPYNIILEPAEEAKLKEVFAAWSANQTDAEKAKVYAALDEIAKVHLPKLEASFKARVKAIPTILTPEQIAAARDWASPQKAPSTRPAGNVANAAE